MDENSILVIRGAGPIGWPGSAEVVNMQPSDDLIKQGIEELPCIGDGRQSGASGSPSIISTRQPCRPRRRGSGRTRRLITPAAPRRPRPG